MGCLTGRSRPSRRGGAAAVVIAVLAVIASAGASSPARAFVIGFGFPYPGFYSAPWPYYPPPVYAPYYPPPSYYVPPSAYYPPAAGAATAPAGASQPTTIASEPLAAASPYAATITYTRRPAFRNASGQTCREYQLTSGARGTACQDADGQWRVAN